MVLERVDEEEEEAASPAKVGLSAGGNRNRSYCVNLDCCTTGLKGHKMSLEAFLNVPIWSLNTGEEEAASPAKVGLLPPVFIFHFMAGRF